SIRQIFVKTQTSAVDKCLSRHKHWQHVYAVDCVLTINQTNVCGDTNISGRQMFVKTQTLAACVAVDCVLTINQTNVCGVTNIGGRQMFVESQISALRRYTLAADAPV